MIPEIRGSDVSCPEGGVFYMCNGFRGCCATDPCMPGSTCPADQNRTLGRSSDASSLTPITSVLMITVTATTSSITSATISSTASQSSLDSGSTLSSAEPSLSDITKIPPATATATTSTSASESTGRAHSSSAGPLVGAVLGTVIFCALLISGFLYVRKRRRAKVYKTPAYPSPLADSDMTPQLSSKASSQFQQKIAALHEAESINDSSNTPQLDSLEISRYEHRRNSSIGRLAELPAEPRPWPGTFAHA